MSAPPVDCHTCGRRIGKGGGHIVTEAGPVVCIGCSEKRSTHAALYPDCPCAWHDVYDHALVMATRAAVPRVLSAGIPEDAIRHKRSIRESNEPNPIERW